MGETEELDRVGLKDGDQIKSENNWCSTENSQSMNFPPVKTDLHTVLWEIQ